MSGVKQSQATLLALSVGLFALAGCESGDLSRFAPPGIVKYEELAGDQPPNPEVAARIEERRQEKDSGSFPVLSQTPGKQDRPRKRGAQARNADINELSAERDALAEDVEADRIAAEADQAADLPAERNELMERLEADNAAAARERREKLQAPIEE